MEAGAIASSHLAGRSVPHRIAALLARNHVRLQRRPVLSLALQRAILTSHVTLQFPLVETATVTKACVAKVLVSLQWSVATEE